MLSNTGPGSPVAADGAATEMFAHEVVWFTHFVNTRSPRWTRNQLALFIDAEAQLRHCQFALAKAKAAADENGRLWTESTKRTSGPNQFATPSGEFPVANHFWGLQFKMRVFAEAFYGYASRLQAMLSAGVARSTGLRFSPVKGITLVKDHLVRRDDGQHETINGSLEVSATPFDVWLKAPTGAERSDPGLAENARRLRANLRLCLSDASGLRSQFST